MNNKIINGMSILQFAVFTAIKRRLVIVGSNIEVAPVVIWFYILQERVEFFCKGRRIGVKMFTIN
jgi:hypothetical protein